MRVLHDKPSPDQGAFSQYWALKAKQRHGEVQLAPIRVIDHCNFIGATVSPLGMRATSGATLPQQVIPRCASLRTRRAWSQEMFAMVDSRMVVNGKDGAELGSTV